MVMVRPKGSVQKAQSIAPHINLRWLQPKLRPVGIHHLKGMLIIECTVNHLKATLREDSTCLQIRCLVEGIDFNFVEAKLTHI
jgi:hypothetical protein